LGGKISGKDGCAVLEAGSRPSDLVPPDAIGTTVDVGVGLRVTRRLWMLFAMSSKDIGTWTALP
jgi:hypothetical protein